MTCNKSKLIDEQISLLKIKQTQQFNALKYNLQTAGENLKPINILKNTANEVVTLVKNEGNILNRMIELGIRSLTKKATSMFTHNRFVSLVSNLLKK